LSDTLLKAVDIQMSFAGVHALKRVTLDIQRGEIHCLAGENGCGKSTLIKIISGVYKPDGGHIEFEGKPYGQITPIEAIANGIQVIYQDFSVFPNLTVMENIAFNSELADRRVLVNRKRMRAIAEQAVKRIHFEVDLHERVGNLSVAQKQMIAISRALLFNAKFIIMDEPTTALTKREVNMLFQMILELKKQGIATLFVSHKLDEVFEISERFTILRGGETVATGVTSDLDGRKFTFYMTGRELEAAPFVPKALGEEPVLETTRLSMAGHFEDVSFSVRRGEVLGITGLLDSGRTELALALFGVRKTTGGEIRVKGKPAAINSPADAIRHGIGYVPEDRLSEGLFLPRPIGDNVVIAEIDNLASHGVLDRAAKRREVERWVRELAIATPDPDNACQTLSGGNQQRVVLAKWLALSLDVLVLNGPTMGVDIGSKHDIHRILQGLADSGMAVILISDDLPEVIANCSRALILRDGRLAHEINPRESDVRTLSELMM